MSRRSSSLFFENPIYSIQNTFYKLEEKVFEHFEFLHRVLWFSDEIHLSVHRVLVYILKKSRISIELTFESVVLVRFGGNFCACRSVTLLLKASSISFFFRLYRIRMSFSLVKWFANDATSVSKSIQESIRLFFSFFKHKTVPRKSSSRVARIELSPIWFTTNEFIRRNFIAERKKKRSFTISSKWFCFLRFSILNGSINCF